KRALYRRRETPLQIAAPCRRHSSILHWHNSSGCRACNAGSAEESEWRLPDGRAASRASNRSVRRARRHWNRPASSLFPGRSHRLFDPEAEARDNSKLFLFPCRLGLLVLRVRLLIRADEIRGGRLDERGAQPLFPVVDAARELVLDVFHEFVHLTLHLLNLPAHVENDLHAGKI